MIILKESIEEIGNTYNNIPIYYVENDDNKMLSFGKRLSVSVIVDSYEEAKKVSDMVLARDGNTMFADPYRIGQWLENKGYELVVEE